MIYTSHSIFFSLVCVPRLGRVNGTDGTIAEIGTTTGDYLYWNAITSKWTIGRQTINLGANAVASGPSVAIGQDGKYYM